MRIFGIVLAGLLVVSCGSTDDSNDLEDTSAVTDEDGSSTEVESASAGVANDGELFVTVEYLETEAGSAEEIPVGEPVESNIDVDQDVDSDAGLPFLLAVDRETVVISWSPEAEFAADEGVIADGTSKVLYINYSDPVFITLEPQVNEESNLVPTIEVESEVRLRISFDAGTEIGDGLETTIDLVEKAPES